MRAAVIAVAALAACATTSAAPSAPPREPCPQPMVEQQQQPPPPPSKQDITAKSHAALLALDHGDHAKLERLLDASYLHFEGGGVTTRDQELDFARKRKPGPPGIAKRTWSKETVQVGSDDAIYIGKALEIQGGNEVHGGGYRFDGWYAFHWRRRAGSDTWKLRLVTWQRAGNKREIWNEIYRNDAGFEKQPNKLLVEVTKTLKPGTALDLATGQGRNALYLASKGWTVTGIDFSEEGLRIARAEAAKRKLTLTTINADIDQWDFGTNKWDLIAMIYPGTNHEAWIEKAKVALKRGGIFVLEFFGAEPERPKDGFLPGALAKLFGDGFVILRDDNVEGQPDWARSHAKLVRFVAKKK